MNKSPYSLYAIFIIVFLIFHLTGVIVAGLPYILNALITFPVVLISLLLLDKWYSTISFARVLSNLGFKRTSFGKILPGILISILLLILYPVLSFLTGLNLYLTSDWFFNLCGLFLTAGLAEEMFFRGFLFRHLRQNMSFKKAALASMLLFAAVHLLMFTYMEWLVALFSTVLAVAVSVPMSYLFERADDTIWSPALVHTVIRTIGLVVSTTQESFALMTLSWIAGCVIIPLLVVVSFKDFRNMWKASGSLSIP